MAWNRGYITIRRLPDEDVVCGYDLNQTVTEDVVEINFRVIDVSAGKGYRSDLGRGIVL
jgi:hypothetical protein